MNTMHRFARTVQSARLPGYGARFQTGLRQLRSSSTSVPSSGQITYHFGGENCAPPRSGVKYSPAAKANGFVFVSGQVAVDGSGEYLSVECTTAEKTHRIIQNVKNILEASGSSLDQVVKANVYFKHLDRDYNEFNKVYSKYFKHAPARSSLEVTGMPKPADLEMEVIAVAN